MKLQGEIKLMVKIKGCSNRIMIREIDFKFSVTGCRKQITEKNIIDPECR